MKVSVIGAGLAGCEAALTLAKNGIEVNLFEMKPTKYSPAHKYPGFAELICSNSLKAMRIESAAGLLKEEMRILGSISIEAAERTAVNAGGALAVDRIKFSDYITEKIRSNPKINVINEEVTSIPDGYCIIASGPLTSESLSNAIQEKINSNYLNFVDAVAPIILAESIDTKKTFMAARYGRGDPDYINCPMNEHEYTEFYNALIEAETVSLKDFEKGKVYEGCMPVEVMAKRGFDTLRFGPLKPVGLTDPITNRRPFAVVQLRCENIGQILYNMVGFQTNLKFAEQKKVFSMIPGMENAEFVRYGVMHLNTFLNSPRILDKYLRLISDNKIFFAGQITGVEGYMESASSGIYTGLNLARILNKLDPITLPNTTMMGSLYEYVSDPNIKDFQPMGANMGILPPIELDRKISKDKTQKYRAFAMRSLEDLNKYLISIS